MTSLHRLCLLQLMVLSNMAEEGGSSSFSIDMFDPSKVDGSDPQPSLPVHQLQEIGVGDLLPSGGICFISLVSHVCCVIVGCV
jgi:hypothetical protein